MNALTILICTHNRADLLERALASLNGARRPALPVQILVAANACSDDTAARMRAYQAQQDARGWLPLTLLEVPTPGKSHALNEALPRVDTELIVHGVTEPNARVTLRGEPVHLQRDGSFAVRFNLPDRRHVLPVVASSGDGGDQRTIVLAVDRNTKVMEPVMREPGE